MLAVPLTDYYEEVRRYLTCPEEVKDDLIYDVNRKVMDLNADRPDLDYDIVALSISLLCLIALKTDVHVVRSDLLTTSSAVQLD